MTKYAYLQQSENDRAKVYDYYRKVLSYPKRYPAVYGEVIEVNKSSDALEVEVRAPLETTSESAPFIARFTFLPQS
ncbi:MAG: hypothetical protein ACRD8W_30105 [Nitrososphaeraceae archaeon]